MLDSKETHIRIHIHQGVSPEVDGATIELGSSDAPEDAGSTNVIRMAYDESTGRAKDLLRFLAENPGERIPHRYVSEALDLDSPRSLPGLLGSFSRRAQDQYGGFKPFASVKVGNQWYLKMPVEVARVVIKLS